MRIARLSKIEWAVIAGVFGLLAALILAPGVAVWDGRFRLTIRIDEDEPIDRDSLVFATCWFEREAVHALANPGHYEYGFRGSEFTDNGHAAIDVPASGRLGVWGTTGSYNHPEHLVVEFRLASSDNKTLRRKRFDIPTGRGPRSLTIALP